MYDERGIVSESTNNTAHPKPKKSTPKRRSPLRVTIAVVAVLIAAFVGASQVYTDWLWFDQLGYSTVFTTPVLLKAAVFVVAAVVIAVPLWASMSYAVRHADVVPASEKEPQEAPNPNRAYRPAARMLPSRCFVTYLVSSVLRRACAATTRAWIRRVRFC